MGKLLVKSPSTKWVGVGRVSLFLLLLFFVVIFLLPFVFVIFVVSAVAVVCLFVLPSRFLFLASHF